MQTQRIVNVVDALRTQDRLIVRLSCGHNASIWKMQVQSGGMTQYVNGAEFICDHCPDPPAPTAEELKTVRQLWREAGEP